MIRTWPTTGPMLWGRTLPPLPVAGLIVAGVLANVWALSWSILEMFVIGPAQGIASAGDDWRVLQLAGDTFMAGGNPYAVDLFRWNPLMAPAMWALTHAMLFSMWTALHVAALFLLPRRLAVIALLTWPFWFDLGVGNVMTFVFIAAYWAYRGNRPATIVFMALALLMPRPLMLPLLVTLLWKQPWTRWWFGGLIVVIGAGTLATGLADEFVVRLLGSGSEAGYVLNLAPSRWIGMWWTPAALLIGAWLTWQGRIGWASIAIQPYLIPNYLLMGLLEARPLERQPPAPQQIPRPRC